MAEQVKKSWYKKWWVWVIAILVLAGIGTAISQGNKSLSHDYSTIDPVGIMENNLKDMQRYEILRIEQFHILGKMLFVRFIQIMEQ